MESQQPSHHSHLASAAVDFKSSPAVMAHKKQEHRPNNLPVSLTDKLPLSVKELMSGGVAGALAKTSVAPFERIKILYQVCLFLRSLDRPDFFSVDCRASSLRTRFTSPGILDTTTD